ncbi:MAG: hypothetical protein JRH04_11965 [Deltaproteobacteria bacterium]|nr:hypothetical protein [Deltaproteobacteria bacterium]
MKARKATLKTLNLDEYEKIAILSVPFFSPDNVLRLKKPVISINKKPLSQQTSNPEKEHEAKKAANGG